MGNICCRENQKQEIENNENKYVRRIYQPYQAHKPSTSELPLKQQSQLSQNPSTHRQENPLKKRSIQNENPIKHCAQNYQSVKYLGKGVFGDVVLTGDKQNEINYAMKIIQKIKIKQFNVLQSDIIKKISQNDLFVKIRQTFQNQTKIYIVMEYLPRGDIYYYLKQKTIVFRQDIIKGLVSQIIVGIQILHNYGIIYRQLKPQNILVTNQGHIKLGDYGLSRMITKQQNQLSTFIGTLSYMPPQAIKGNYDKKADIWAIGILMYQLKFEQNLFEKVKNQSIDQIKSNIQNINIEDQMNDIVGKVSYDFRDVIIKLLQKQPEKRISLEQLKKHPFFEGIIWQDIPLRKNHPPLKQILQSDHIKFRDPQQAHRQVLEKKNQNFQMKLYEFIDGQNK